MLPRPRSLPPSLLQVRITPKKGKAILISGHDLQDTHDLLAQTEGKGEPCWLAGRVGYPELWQMPLWLVARQAQFVADGPSPTDLLILRR